MSAYIVSDETICVLVKGIIEYGINTPGVYFDTTATVFVNNRFNPIGQWLLNQNYDSVNFRYRENTPTPVFSYKEPKEYNEGILLGCINCYEYQADEAYDYSESYIHITLTQLKQAMLERMIERSGYEIPWGA